MDHFGNLLQPSIEDAIWLVLISREGGHLFIVLIRIVVTCDIRVGSFELFHESFKFCVFCLGDHLGLFRK